MAGENTIFILAGETSGDMYGALLAKRIEETCQGCEIYGMGGKAMYASNVKILADPTKIAVIGLWEALNHIKEFKYIFDTMLKYILDMQPRVVVLIDYPGFNLRIAKAIKRMAPHIRIVYYISPQVWAWGKRRIKLIKKYIDEMLVIFPFEEKFYKENGVENVHFVGHPLREALDKVMAMSSLFAEYSLDKQRPLIALLPGSREKEVRRHLPAFLRSVEKLKGVGYQFVIHKADNVQDYVYKDIMSGLKTNIPLIERPFHPQSFRAASLAWVASGTATIETAFYEVPMIAVYKVSPITYLLLRPFVKIKWIAMVNIVLGEPVVPELVQNRFTEDNLALTTRKMLADEDMRAEIKSKLKRLKDVLYRKNASQEAAKYILHKKP